jgi:putative restriction endonuclease
VTASEWASRIWPVLILAARNRQILTYDILAKLIGQIRPALGRCLEPIQSYCIFQKLPPLTILVVSGKTGLPGSGFIAAQDIPSKQMEVFRHNWAKTPVPSIEDLELAQRTSDAILALED